MKPSGKGHSPTLADIGEAGFLKRLTRLLGPAPPDTVGLGDDAAVVPMAKGAVLLTTDCMVENVHFRRDWFRPEEVGHKALAANLSDAAAMGGQAECALVSLILPPDTRANALERMYRGMRKLADREKVAILGGNMARGRTLSVTVTLLGTLPRGEPWLRSGARPGDRLYLTGQPGLGFLGRRMLEAKPSRHPDLWKESRSAAPSWRRERARSIPGGVSALKRFLTPEARLATARDLLIYRPTAAVDVSDGLATDLQHIAGKGRGLVVDAQLLPRTPAFRKLAAALEEDPVQAALIGGEDYELLVTLPPETAERLGPRAILSGTVITLIGEVTAEDGVRLREGSRTKQISPVGFRHFGKAGRG